MSMAGRIRDILFCPGPAGGGGPHTARLHAVALGLCLAAAVLVRLYGAWAFRYITDPDCGIVALMARHMAAGREFPVFFYGQDYMGSLEPAVSAVLCRLFGAGGLMVCLGTALLAVLSLPVIYAWARDAGGRAAGLAALAVCIVGPYFYLMFQFAPRGGYMATLLFGTAVMWLGSRGAEQAWNGHPPGAWRLAAIGLLAGLGWWTNPIVLSALLASAAVLAIGFRGRPPLRTVAAGLGGFLIGSAPFWWWNATQGWPTLAILADAGRLPARVGAAFLGARYARLMQLPDGWPDALRGAALAAPLVVAAGGVLWGLVSSRRGPRRFNAPFVCALLFLALSLVFFVRSGFAAMNTARYLIPLVPAAALLVGLAVSGLRERLGPAAAVAPVLLLVALQVHGLAALRRTARAVPAKQAFEATFDALLREHAIEAAYGHFKNHSFNFNLDGAVAFTTLTGERYVPIARRAELADRIAVLENMGRLTDFLATGGGTARLERLPGLRAHLDFEPPPIGRAELAPGLPATIRTPDGVDLAAVLTDRNRDTAWSARADEDAIEIAFDRPCRVRLIRLLAPADDRYPRRAALDVRRAGEARWRRRFDAGPVTRFYWSGPRLYSGGEGFRWVYRLDDEPVEALRLVASSPHPWALSELQVFGPPDETVGAAPTEAESLDRLLRAIRAQGIRRLYSDRWVANRVWQAFDGDVAAVLFPRAFPGEGLNPGARIRPAPDTALLTLEPDAAGTRAVLRRHAVAWTELALPPWVLFVFGDDAGGGDVAPPLYWAGFGCLTGHSRAYAFDLLAQARGRLAGAERDAAAPLALLREAVDWYPGIVNCGVDVLDALRASLAGGLPPELDRLADEVARPGIPIDAEFEQGIRLEGLTPPRDVVAGQTVDLTWYWRCPSSAARARWRVFVHFRRDGTVFQDDHPLLSALIDRTLDDQPCPERFGETRRVAIPADAPPGRYAIHVGLYRVPGGQRARVRAPGALRRAVVIADALTVKAPDPS